MIKKDAGGIYQEFLNEIDYKTTMGFVQLWPELTRFVEGKQWPPSTEATKHMPRPVINMCDQTVENKRSNILSQQLKMQFRPKEMQEDNELPNEIAQDFSDMAEKTWYEIDQDTLTEEMVNDAIVLGNGIIHYYYDNTYKGGTYTKYIGKICGESIDPMDVVMGNNQLKPYQIQQQPFIIVRRRKDFDKVVEQAKKTGEDWDKIEPDKNVDADEKYDSAKVENRNANQVTTYTKYYKERGEVYFVEVTKSATVRKPKRFAPEIENDDGTKDYEPFKVYPCVHLGFKRRRKSVYYRSLIEDMIPSQKALNFGMGMQLLSMQQAAWPKIIAKMGALTQQVTNMPGEILIDNYQAGGDGFKYMQPANISSNTMALTQTIMEMTKNVAGVSEVSTGESIGANMAASAIIALQNQAQKPNDGYMRNVVSCIKQVGEIWEAFYKSFYNLPVPIKGKDEDGKEITKLFMGEKGRGIEFDLVVDVGPASMFSESLQVSVLDTYADRQWIDKYTHADNMPTSVLPQKLREKLAKEKIQADEQSKAMEQANGLVDQLTPDEQMAIDQNPQIMEGLV